MPNFDIIYLMRITIKISGEAIGNGTGGYDFDMLGKISEQIQELQSKKYEILIIVGGGNIFRGSNIYKELNIKRTTADYMGMLATTQNGLVLRDFFITNGIKTILSVSMTMEQIAESYIPNRIKHKLDTGSVVIFSGGIGLPYFSTDIAVVQRALEMDAEYIIMTKNNVDGIYDKDPNKEKGAKKYDKITTTEILNKNLSFADSTAISLMRENKLKAKVVSLFEISKATEDGVGTEIIPD